jgi:hypothetical protein
VESVYSTVRTESLYKTDTLVFKGLTKKEYTLRILHMSDAQIHSTASSSVFFFFFFFFFFFYFFFFFGPTAL